MDNIRIFKKNNADYIDLPRTKKITYAEEPVVYETQMASGKLVQDIMGMRPVFSAQFSYIPADIMQEIIMLLRANGFFKVTYPAPTGEETGMFKITEDAGQKIFKFINGQPMWYGMTLTFTAQAVLDND